MGIFPIIMNVLQFWLIDSIVKASAAAGLALDSDDPDALDGENREPLFGAPSDDEDEDDTTYRQHDIENPRHTQRPHSPIASRSRSPDKPHTGSQSPDEQKGSLSGTPGPPNDAHSYPPSLSGSIASSSSPTLPSRSPKPATKLLKKARRRSPPRPLEIRTAFQPAVNSPQVTATLQPTPQPVSEPLKPTVRAAQETGGEWADSWDDSDDWATRVGEDEWTGRRMEEKKENLHTMNHAWANSPSVQVHS